MSYFFKILTMLLTMINCHALRLTSKPFGSLTANSYYETKTVSRYVPVTLLYVSGMKKPIRPKKTKPQAKTQFVVL